MNRPMDVANYLKLHFADLEHESFRVMFLNGQHDLIAQLVDALNLIDVEVLDHIVIGGDKSYSFAEHGLI